MLEHLTASKGILSADLIRDLRSLCGLPKDQLDQIAEVFSNTAIELGEDSVAEEAMHRLHANPENSEQLRSAVSAGIFLWRKWAIGELTREQILSDLQSLSMAPNEIPGLSGLLDVMEGLLHVVSDADNDREDSAFQRLLPQLLSQMPGRFVAILDGEVFGEDDDEFELTVRVTALHPKRFVLIRRVTAQPEVVFIASLHSESP